MVFLSIWRYYIYEYYFERGTTVANIKEIYDELGLLLKKHPEISDLEVCACGVNSRLNVFRQAPDGPVTGLSLEDASYMEGHISNAEEMVRLAGGGILSEQHMEYLIQMSMEEASEEEMQDFVKKYAGPEVIKNKKDKSFFVYEGQDDTSLKGKKLVSLQKKISSAKDELVDEQKTYEKKHTEFLR